MIIQFNSFGASGGGSGTGSVVSWEQEVTAGTQIASITINGTSQNVYAPEGGDEEKRRQKRGKRQGRSGRLRRSPVNFI